MAQPNPKDKCNLCNTAFGYVFGKKHRCRNCNRYICSSCSQFYGSVRHCKQCFEIKTNVSNDKDGLFSSANSSSTPTPSITVNSPKAKSVPAKNDNEYSYDADLIVLDDNKDNPVDSPNLKKRKPTGTFMEDRPEVPFPYPSLSSSSTTSPTTTTQPSASLTPNETLFESGKDNTSPSFNEKPGVFESGKFSKEELSNLNSSFEETTKSPSESAEASKASAQDRTLPNDKFVPLQIQIFEISVGIIFGILKGMLDSLKCFQCTFLLLKGSLTLRSIMFDYLLLNGLLLLTLYQLFWRVFRPHYLNLFQESGSSLYNFCDIFVIGFFYGIWIIPVYIISLGLNGSWNARFASKAIAYSKGIRREGAGKPVLSSDELAAALYRSCSVLLFTSISLCFSFVPYLGSYLYFILLCFVYSITIFSFTWGRSFTELLIFVEDRLPYFLGFGVLFTLSSFFLDIIPSCCVFALCLPLFLAVPLAINGEKIKPLKGPKIPLQTMLDGFITQITRIMIR